MSLSTGPIAPRVAHYQATTWHKEGNLWTVLISKDGVTRHVDHVEAGPDWACSEAHRIIKQWVSDDCRINDVPIYQLNINTHYGVIHNGK